MKKKIAGILVTILLILTTVPILSSANEKVNDNYDNLMSQVIGNGAISRDDWNEQAKLLASDGAANNVFGRSVSIDGDTAIIGAYNDDDNGPHSGSAYIFIRSGTTWTEQAKLLPSDGEESDWFGYSVSVDSDTVIIGALFDDDHGENSGSAYVFTRTGTTWSEQEKLLASDSTPDDRFGWSVSIEGDIAIIGASYDDDNGDRSGSAYVFKRDGSNWNEQAKLLASDGVAYDMLGYSVSIDGDTAIIGTPHVDYVGGGDLGSAYVFTLSGTAWTEQAKLQASDGKPQDYFGFSVSIEGDTAIIGTIGDDYNGEYTGSAYIFVRSGTTWSQEAKLIVSDGATNDYFGYSVSIDNDIAIISSPEDDDNGDRSGSAYIFKRDGTSWTQQAKLLASDGAAVDYFGISVSVNGNTALIGARMDDDNGIDSGSAYVFIKESENQPPNAPTIDGPTSGSVGISYTYQFTSEDPDGDDIAEYIVNWGVGSYETIAGPFASGSPATKNHTWTKQDTYTIRARAKDLYGAESDWAELSVIIPRNKMVNRPILKLLEQYPILYQLLQRFTQF